MKLPRWRRKPDGAAATRALLAATRRYLVPELPEPQGLLAAGAAYWLTVDAADDVDWLVMQIAQSQSPGIDVALIGCGRVAAVPAASRVRRFRLDADQLGAALPRLTSDLIRARLEHTAIVVLVVPDSAWGVFNPAELARWCQLFTAWLVAHGTTLVVISQGPAEWPARAASASVAGNARLYRAAGQRRYHLDSWRAPGGACADQDYTLTDAGAFVRVLPPVGTGLPAAPGARGPVLVERGALDDAKALPSAWQVFDRRGELFEHAGTLTAATVVLGVHAVAEIEPLARVLFRLRGAGAVGLTVVVRERIPDIADLDRRLLTACGVRLVVGFATPLEAFWEVLRALRGTPLAVPSAGLGFDALRAGLRAPAVSGWVAPAVFAAALSAVYAQLAAAPQHRLLRIVPRGQLGAARCLAQMVFERPGEFACVVAGVVWLFLFGCDEEAEAPTLGRLCRLPANVLFGRLDLFTATDGIPAELALAANDATPPPPAAPAAVVPSVTPPPFTLPAPVQPRAARLGLGAARG